MTKPIKVDLGARRNHLGRSREVDAEQAGPGVRRRRRGGCRQSRQRFRSTSVRLRDRPGELTEMRKTADETALELSAKLTTNGNLLIVQGSAEGAIKLTMKWKKPDDKKST